MENKYKAQKAYEKRNDIIVKAFKVKRNVADQFKATCEKAGVSQAAKITELMKQFIDETNNSQKKGQ